MCKRKLGYILITSILLVIFLYMVDRVYLIPYIQKSLIKIILLTVIILIYIAFYKDNFIKVSMKNINFKKDIVVVFTLSLLIITSIVSVFFIMLSNNLINVSDIKNDFYYKYKIHKDNVIYYMIYLCFINALLEEVFFRGFLFLNLKNIGMKKFAYIFSSTMFSVYHIANFLGWVNVYVFYFLLLALFIGGTIFNYFDDKINTFFNSYILHVSADVGICICGAYIFFVI